MNDRKCLDGLISENVYAITFLVLQYYFIQQKGEVYPILRCCAAGKLEIMNIAEESQGWGGGDL